MIPLPASVNTAFDALRDIDPDSFAYHGTPAVLFRLDQPLPNDALHIVPKWH